MRKPLKKSVRFQVFNAYNWKCNYCGIDLKELGRNATIDHINHVYMGGDNSIENLVPACRSCNSARGPMDKIEFLEYLERKYGKRKD